MSERPGQLPPPPNPAVVTVFGAVTYLAALVALWGLLSFALDRDVIDYPDAGPLLGPAMATAATVATTLALLSARTGLGVAIGVLGSYAAMLVVAAVAYAPVASARFAISPFVLGAAALAGVTVIAVAGIRSASRRR